MTATAYFYGQALALFAFEETKSLYPELRLSVRDKDGLHSLCLECAQAVPDAVYRAKDDLWFIHFDTLHEQFWSFATDKLLEQDVTSLKRWFARGDFLPQGDDPAMDIWLGSLSRAYRHGWDVTGLPEGEIDQVNAFINSYIKAWRSEDFFDAIDALREAPDTDVSLMLKVKFNINMFDDVDPLISLTGGRKGNILVEEVNALPEDFPFDLLARVSEPWLDSNPDYSRRLLSHDQRSIAQDIRCVIRI